MRSPGTPRTCGLQPAVRCAVVVALTCGALIGVTLLITAKPQRQCGFDSTAVNLSVRASSERLDVVGIVSVSDEYEIQNFAKQARSQKVCVSTTRLTTAPTLRPRPFLEILATLRPPEKVAALWGGGGVTLRGSLTRHTLTELQLSASEDPHFPVDALSVTLLP